MNADQLSHSAAFIAIKFYGLSREPQFQFLFDEEVIRFYESIVQALPRPLCYYHYWLQFDWVRALYIKSEELLLPGDLPHILARKWYISRMLDKLLDQGYEQLLVLGGGFDHLAFQSTQRGIPSLEIDSPRMARLKKDFLRQRYPDYPHPLILPVQLAKGSLISTLDRQQHISPQEKTVIISEGFFDYISSKDIHTTLSMIQNYFTSPALISTHFALNELPLAYRFVFRSSLQLVGEELKLNNSIDELKATFSQHQFAVEKCYNSTKLTDKFLNDLDTDMSMLQGFYLLQAR
jgi:O-methyltransferase involved in polyketide biosynthesis